MVAELRLDPGAAVVGEHLHPGIHETFEVLEGHLGYRLDDVQGTARAGDRIDISPGSWHDWWHEGEGEAVVRVTVTPGDRFEQMIRTLWGLACDGRTNAKGMPGILQLAAISAEFSDVFVLRKPPRLVQRAMFGALTPIARRRGYRGCLSALRRHGLGGHACSGARRRALDAGVWTGARAAAQPRGSSGGSPKLGNRSGNAPRSLVAHILPVKAVISVTRPSSSRASTSSDAG